MNRNPKKELLQTRVRNYNSLYLRLTLLQKLICIQLIDVIFLFQKKGEQLLPSSVLQI